MKQTEFELKLIELKAKWNTRIAEHKRVANSIKEERINLGREIAEKEKKRSMLRQQEHTYFMQVSKMEQEAREEISKFKNENYSDSRKLEEVSDVCLIKELVARGFTGEVNHKEKTAEFLSMLNGKLRDNTPPTGDIVG